MILFIDGRVVKAEATTRYKTRQVAPDPEDCKYVLALIIDGFARTSKKMNRGCLQICG
jgi:hypothetical protein